MPNRTAFVGATLLALVAVAQAWRAYTGLSLAVGSYQVPIMVSWAAAGLFGVVAILLFRASHS